MIRSTTTTFSEDEIIGKAYDSRLMKRLLNYLRPYKTRAVTSIALLLGISLLQLIVPYLTKIAIDNHIMVGDWQGIDRIAILYLIVLVAIFAFQYIQVYIMQSTGQRVMYDLRYQLFSHLQKMSLSYFDRNPVGRLITRTVNDVEVLNEMFTSGMVVIFGDFFILFGITVILFVLNWKLALIVFSIIPLLFYATIIYRNKARKAYREIRTNLARLNSYLHENIAGMSTVQGFCKETENFKRFAAINMENRNSQLRSITYNAVFFPTIEIFAASSIALIIWYGGGQVIQDTILPGVLVAFIQYLQRFFKPLSDLAEKYNIMQAAMASSERIFKVLDTNEDVSNPASPIYLNKIRGEIRFADVWFAYNACDSHNGDQYAGNVPKADHLQPIRETRPFGKGRQPENDPYAHTKTTNNHDYVLKGVSFHLNPGESMAIVGATGSGKTSIINLLGRSYEIQQGGIFIDGVDIRRMDKYWLRRQIGIVLQDVFLFSGSIEDNIRMGNEEIPFSRVKEAARYVNADSFIERFPQTYQHEVQERGCTLSQGQKQLLAFARVLAYDPRIIVLDEATSNVDTETELLIRDAIKKLIKGRTSIIIAHRLSTIKDVDRIIVMKHGEIVEAGTHETLLKRQGIYYQLYHLQYRRFNTKGS